jgi:hypothetical protein
MPELSAFVAEIAIGKLRSCKSSGSNQISVELFQAGGEILGPSIVRAVL